MSATAKRRFPVRSLIFIMAAFTLFCSGCGPTYPKKIVDKAIVQLCREEYGIDVKVKIMRNTVGIYIPLDELFDSTLRISKKAADKINDVILSASRVTLSTDAPLDFYIVIAQDKLLPEIEVVLIRYVMDIKKLHFGQISRGEFAKRMIVDIKVTPQAQKEKVLRDIFSRLNINRAGNLIDEYMKTSGVASIGDIGYWQDTFFIKNIQMGEFLSLQIAHRAKAEIMSASEFKESFKLTAIAGSYLEESGKRLFRFSFSALAKKEPEGFMGADFDPIYKVMIKEAADVIHGYKFDNFWNIEVVNSQNKQVVFVARAELEKFRKKGIKLEELKRWYR